MANNNRVYYACQSVQLAGPSGTNAPANTAFTTIQGLQSVGINTNFNLEPIYQLGQLDLYENFEDIPDVEVSLNKVLDGMPTIYSMAADPIKERVLLYLMISQNRCGYYNRAAPIRVRELIQRVR